MIPFPPSLKSGRRPDALTKRINCWSESRRAGRGWRALGSRVQHGNFILFSWLHHRWWRVLFVQRELVSSILHSNAAFQFTLRLFFFFFYCQWGYHKQKSVIPNDFSFKYFFPIKAWKIVNKYATEFWITCTRDTKCWHFDMFVRTKIHTYFRHAEKLIIAFPGSRIFFYSR